MPLASEERLAVIVANRALDRDDPDTIDDDLSVLARQFLAALKRAQELESDNQVVNAKKTQARTLEERVLAFNLLQLPGQPYAMHIGTSYLVNDLWAEVKRLRNGEHNNVGPANQ